MMQQKTLRTLKASSAGSYFYYGNYYTCSKCQQMYPQVESYIISFAVIAIFWISYHQVFNFITRSHISMVYLNLLFLLLITFLSITTSLVINYGSYQIPYVIF